MANFGPFYSPPFPAYPGVMPPYPTQSRNQNGSFIHVPSEQTAREWPLGPGDSATFVNDNAPYCYTKTMGMSQLDPFIFKRYRIIEEDASTPEPDAKSEEPKVNYLTKDDVSMIFDEYVRKDTLEPIEKRLDEVYRKLEKLKELTD